MNLSVECKEPSWLNKNSLAAYYLLVVSLIIVIILSIGLVAVIWRRCSHAENYTPQNMIMYFAGFSNVVTSVGTLIYLMNNKNAQSCDRTSDDLLYFVAFPSLIIRELLVALFAINRYAVCVYGLTYHLRMNKRKMGIVIIALYTMLYVCLVVIHQVSRMRDNDTLASLEPAFKILWAACEISATFLLCFFNLLLYYLAKSKAGRKPRVHPIENTEEMQGKWDLFVQNVKRTTGTLFASLYYAARMLPHAAILVSTTWISTPSVQSAGRAILLIKYILGIMDPVVQCLSIKMIKEGVKAEWNAIRETIANICGGRSN